MIDGSRPAAAAVAAAALQTPAARYFHSRAPRFRRFMPRGVTDMGDRDDRRDARKYLNVMRAGNGCQNSIWTNLRRAKYKLLLFKSDFDNEKTLWELIAFRMERKAKGNGGY